MCNTPKVVVALIYIVFIYFGLLRAFDILCDSRIKKFGDPWSIYNYVKNQFLYFNE